MREKNVRHLKTIWASVFSLSAVALVASAGPAFSQSMDEIMAGAKTEGQLTIIAVPHDWCGYGAVIDGFKAKYGLKVNELNPDAGSGDEIEAVKANKGNTGPQAPDVIDVGLSFGPSAKKDGLLQPYKGNCSTRVTGQVGEAIAWTGWPARVRRTAS